MVLIYDIQPDGENHPHLLGILAPLYSSSPGLTGGSTGQHEGFILGRHRSSACAEDDDDK
jgi:hypothetical protein